ncbi:MAG: hypothetical protein NT091_00250, partial [Candidatus Falkowbacteria bacterium]|nr:hypothetical protein [Candidatus Falkowbacteria bacterium]
GSTSTLVVELGIALEVKFSRIALITLALGIFTDTKDLKFIAKKRDAPAYLWLINSEEDINDDLTELQDFKLPISYFDHLRYALSHMAISGPKFITSLGIISKDDGDNLAIIADELLKAEGINLVVVFAIIGRHIRVSARSSDSALSLDDYLKGIFGAECSGAKSLYGGYSEGGALIEFFNMSWVDSTKTPEESKAFVFSQMRSKIFPTNSEN